MPVVTPENKRKRIEALIARLEAGNSVQARDVNLVLTDKQIKAMDDAWAKQKELRNPTKPKAIVQYEKLLKQAVMLHGRYEKYEITAAKTDAIVDRKIKKAELHDKTALALKEAQDSLLDAISKQSNLVEWFDRKVELNGVDIGIVHELLPRLITSRSETKLVGLKDQQSYKTITENKLDALRSALVEVDADIAQTDASNKLTEEQSILLRKKLAALKKSI
jgi:hypothetical protein